MKSLKKYYLNDQLKRNFSNLSHVVHDAIHIELSSAEQDVLSRLLHSSRQQRVRFVHLKQTE